MLKANVIGLDSYLKRLQTAKKTVQAEVSGEIGDAAFKFRDDAARTKERKIAADRLATNFELLRINYFVGTFSARCLRGA